MKKRLLITSIVMMLVVAVALSTATYAWFTSNTSVKADEVVLTASTMSGAAILITHSADGSDAQQSITLTSAGSSLLYPATPKAANSFSVFYGNEATSEEIAANSINNIAANFQNLIMTGTGKYSDPHIEGNDVSFYKDTFYVFNKGFQAVTLTPTVTIKYDTSSNTSAMAAQSARIAIVERVATTEANLETNVPFAADAYSLKGIWQYDASNSVYAAVENAAVFSATQTYYTRTNTGTEQAPEYEYSVAEVTSETYDGLKSTLFIKTASIAASGANSTYGAIDGGASGFSQGGVTFSPIAFTAIGAATSGKHIANEYTVVVWLEGWDADCTNAITSGSFRVDLSFDAA